VLARKTSRGFGLQAPEDLGGSHSPRCSCGTSTLRWASEGNNDKSACARKHPRITQRKPEVIGPDPQFLFADDSPLSFVCPARMPFAGAELNDSSEPSCPSKENL
jgi:hypothetical protein